MILNPSLTREQCLELLKQKHCELGRLPVKKDFDTRIYSKIKSYYGPWPRALEAAGIKPVTVKRSPEYRQKRIINKKIKKRYYKILRRKNENNEE